MRDVVGLQQVLKKWRKQASSSSSSSSNKSNSSSGSGNNNKGMRFLKKTLSFSESSTSPPSENQQVASVPKGFLAVCVGKEMKRFVIPMQYLNHSIFVMLLRQAEEEFGFQNEGVLRIPCEVPMFENILQLKDEGEKYDGSSPIPPTFNHNYSSSSPDSDYCSISYQHYS